MLALELQALNHMPSDNCDGHVANVQNTRLCRNTSTSAYRPRRNKHKVKTLLNLSELNVVKHFLQVFLLLSLHCRSKVENKLGIEGSSKTEVYKRHTWLPLKCFAKCMLRLSSCCDISESGFCFSSLLQISLHDDNGGQTRRASTSALPGGTRGEELRSRKTHAEETHAP